MLNEAQTAYPAELEVLLCEGCQMIVLAVDTGVRIANDSKGKLARFSA